MKTLLAILCFFQVCCALSYEGYINKIPVWIDLAISNNHITGTYFYKKVGKDIKLTGEVKNNNFLLYELGKKNDTTGIFEFTQNDSITGIWKKPNSKKSLDLRLFKADPLNRQYAIIPNEKKLRLSNSQSFGDELDAFPIESTDEPGPKSNPRPKPEVLYAQRNILSLTTSFEYMGAYPTSEVCYHTFDLTTNKEISLLDEIEPSKKKEFNKYYVKKVQIELIKVRKQTPDSEWIDAFHDGKDIDKNFVIKDATIHHDFYVENSQLHFVIINYFGFPHVIQSMDFSCDIILPSSEVNKFLKKSSMLNF